MNLEVNKMALGAITNEIIIQAEMMNKGNKLVPGIPLRLKTITNEVYKNIINRIIKTRVVRQTSATATTCNGGNFVIKQIYMFRFRSTKASSVSKSIYLQLNTNWHVESVSCDFVYNI